MPADIKAVTDKITKLTADYFKAIKNVKSGKELASAINRYADGMEKLSPAIKTLEAKYGTADNDEDEENSDDSDYPEFEKEWAELMSGSDMDVNFQNLAKYSSDPEVKKAMKRLESVMQKIGISDEESDNEEDEGDSEADSEEE
jgi:ribosome assembly protein YihI (activator of Der GTPase)